MTTYDGLGLSEYTPKKQELLSSILAMHLAITERVMPKWKATHYHYYDLNAGPGRYTGKNKEQIIGSPLVFLTQAQIVGIPTKTVLVEQCAESCASLERHVKRFGDVEVRHGNNADFLSEFSRPRPKVLGLVYADPTSPLFDLPFDALSRFSILHPHMDILIHIAANGIKRCVKDHDTDLRYRIGQLNKNNWLVMEPNTKWQWTFLLGSNGDIFKDYKRINFYRMETQRGRDIFERLNYSKEERAAIQQLTLPELSRVPETPDVPTNSHACHAAEQWALRTMRAKATHRGASRQVPSVGNLRRS